MPVSSASLVIPDSMLAKQATDLLREHATDLLFNHSMRVYFFAAEQGRQSRQRFDPEILYVAAAFTTSASSRNTPVQTNASKSMVRT